MTLSALASTFGGIVKLSSGYSVLKLSNCAIIAPHTGITGNRPSAPESSFAIIDFHFGEIILVAVSTDARKIMRIVIKVTKHSYGYVVYINGSGRGFTNVLGSHHASVAAEAAIRVWEDYRNEADGLTVEVPPEVEAVIAARGRIPWG